MTIDHTQQQSTEDVALAKDLSLAATRPPAEVPGYQAERLLGRGAYGEVWIGVDRNTGRKVAIKFFSHRSGVDWTLLSREVEKLVYLSADRYVVQLLQVGWDSEPPFYVMEFVENGSLDQYLQQQGPLPVAEATDIFRELVVGLVHAHGKGVLHCDLKPANVLLDQDHRPRLADFGQSRLSHEQLPALGTLFYMAPEQADLESVPDARWDVYALGAILFRMLTGEPPYRHEQLVRRIEQVGDLRERLAMYREFLRSAPPLASHRRVKGIDRSLADILERCLAIDPAQRFANVQEVLDALHNRETWRHRRLLLFSGFAGPILLLLVMALFGLRGYEHAMRDSEEFVSMRARESNEFAAKFAARSLEGEISRYFRVARHEAEQPELIEHFTTVADLDLVRQLNHPERTPDEVAQLRPSFIDDPARIQLNDYLERRLHFYLDRLRQDYRELKFASIMALDANGRMLAVAYDSEIDTLSVGWNYAYRSYFHGGSADLPGEKEVTSEAAHPVTKTHLSGAFKSTTTGSWKVAVSTPVYRSADPNAELCGVLALSVNLGDFAYFRSNNRPDRFAVLIDGRPGPNFGVVLQHPLLDQLNEEAMAASESTAKVYRIREEQLERIRREKTFLFHDPLASAPGGEPYAGGWIAALDWVRLPDVPEVKQEMIVLVQERFQAATAPVKSLGMRLKREGLWALGGVLAVILVLWYVVIRALGEPRYNGRGHHPAR